MKKLFYTLLLLASAFCAAQSEFVVEKKQARAQSISTCRQRYCEQCGFVLKLIPHAMRGIPRSYPYGDNFKKFLHALADVQEVMQDSLEAYWVSDKSSFCMRSSKHELAECSQVLSDIGTILSNFKLKTVDDHQVGKLADKRKIDELSQLIADFEKKRDELKKLVG